MGTFDSIYLNKIKQLQEENNKLRAMLNEIDSFKAGKLRDEHGFLHSASGSGPQPGDRGSGPQPGRAAIHFAGVFAQRAKKTGRELTPEEKAAIQRHAENDAEYERRVGAANRPSI